MPNKKKLTPTSAAISCEMKPDSTQIWISLPGISTSLVPSTAAFTWD